MAVASGGGQVSSASLSNVAAAKWAGKFSWDGKVDAVLRDVFGMQVRSWMQFGVGATVADVSTLLV